jgi:murein DD-endopeptidase MepM/ murein hydrolase activator NlpD
LSTTLTTLLWAKGLYKQTVVQQEQNHFLEDRLTEKEAFLESQVRQAQALRQQSQGMLDELRQIQITEDKIRRFLGLSERPKDMKRSNQGGMGPSRDGSHLKQEVSRMASLQTGEKGRFFKSSQSLQSSLQEVLAHLEGKRMESRRLPMLLPASSDKAWLSSVFGWRKDPISGARREFHQGIDIAGPWKSPIITPADGTVVKVGKHRLLGVYVKVKHSKKIKTLYGHLAAAVVKVGQKVKRGDTLGYMGNSGRSTGTHLHYGVAINGKYVNPLDFVWDRPFRSLNL